MTFLNKIMNLNKILKYFWKSCKTFLNFDYTKILT
jgi:hypothetical protein